MTFAEESTAWPGVSRPTYSGGLGFTYKWNMGWMNDTLAYMREEPIHRKHHHDKMTFGLVYAFNENFVLPLSHDEVVHGKGSLVAKMPGDEWQQFANLRAYFGAMFCHPGKKLLFMGAELAQRREWDHDGSLDWHLLEHSAHAGIQKLVRDLNRLYRDTPALYELDFSPDGFDWIDWKDRDQQRFFVVAPRPRWQYCGLRYKFHAGDPLRLSNRRARCRCLHGDNQHGLFGVRRQQPRKCRQYRCPGQRIERSTLFPEADVTPACDIDTEASRISRGHAHGD